MKNLYFLGILVQLCFVHSKYNITQNDHTLQKPRAPEPTTEPEKPVWYYFPIVIGILVILVLIVILYTHGKRRAARRRRRRAERPEMHISDPVEGNFNSLMGNASADVVPVNTCITGKPQLKAKMLHTFSEEESLKNTFENSNYGEDGEFVPFEDYVNTNDLGYAHDSCAMASQPNCRANRNMNTNITMQGRVGNSALKKKPFIPPAISVELVRKQSEKDYQIDTGNQKKTHGALVPDWGRGKEELLYDNQNSAFMRAAKSFDNFRGQGAEQQPLYVNNAQAIHRKKETSRNHLTPELPVKQKLRRADGFGAKTNTWEKERNPDYENFLGEDHCVGGSWQRGAVYHKNKNRAYVIGQGAKAIDQNNGADYENAPSFGGNLLPRTQGMSPSCGLQAATKVTIRESGRRIGFRREEHKAVRRSRSNVDAMLEPAYRNEAHNYGQGVLESRENHGSENHKTNTESLMHLLGLPVNLSCPDQVQTSEEDDDTYVPMDDYDDNCA